VENSRISWTHNTFNPWIGCQHVHEGCLNCYAESDMDLRRGRAKWGPNGERSKTAFQYWKEPLTWEKQAIADGATLTGGCLKRPRVFCASLADIFEEWSGPIVDHRHNQMFVSPTGMYRTKADGSPVESPGWRPLTMDDLRRDLFKLIEQTPHLDWLLVTKRPQNAVFMIEAAKEIGTTEWQLNNCWLLASVSTQKSALSMLPGLLSARPHFPVLGLSAEPLLGPIELDGLLWCRHHNRFEPTMVMDETSPCFRGQAAVLDLLDWVIGGGESGRPDQARPCDVDWLGLLIDQCRDHDVAYFNKQLGTNCVKGAVRFPLKDYKGGDEEEWPKSLLVQEYPTYRYGVKVK
jgi:protein gp37